MITEPMPSCNKEKVNAFAKQFISDTAAAVRAGLNYIGDRLGIFKAMAESGPITAEALAQRTGLNARYLQEWLSALTTAQYIDYDPVKDTYLLPSEHALVLVDESYPLYGGGALQMPVPLLSYVPRVMEAFRLGGGVSHDAHNPELTEAIERFTRPFFASVLTQKCIPEMPDTEQKLKDGCLAADIGCGAGQASIIMAKAYPKSQFYGFDNHAPSIERAVSNANKAGVKNVHFECTDANSIMKKGQFALVTTFDVIHDMVDPLAGLCAIRELLTEGGTYMMLEMNASDRLEENINPFGSLLYSVSTLYCLTVSLAECGAGIGACMGESKARTLTQEAGFNHFRRLPIENPFSIIYEVKV